MKLKKAANGNIQILEDDDTYSGQSLSSRLVVSGLDEKTAGGGVIVAFGNKNDAPADVIRKTDYTEVIRVDGTQIDTTVLTLEEFALELDTNFFFDSSVRDFIQYSNTSLLAPFSTSSLVPVLVFSHTFNAINTESWVARVTWDYFIDSANQKMDFEIRYNGVIIYNIVKEAKDVLEVSIITTFATLGAVSNPNIPLNTGVNTLELYAYKVQGASAIQISTGGFSTERKI